jgi:hypothetical protein
MARHSDNPVIPSIDTGERSVVRISVLPIIALFWFGAMPAAGAAGLDTAIPDHPGVTAFGLMKLVVTDLALDGNGGAVGHTAVPFAHIHGKDQTGAPAETINLDGSKFDLMAIPGDPSRILLLADLGPQDGFVADAQALALIALAPTPRLLDVVEVGMDRVTVFGEKVKPLMLAPRVPLILIENGHDDSDQDFTTVEMMFIRGDRFQWIGDFTTLDEEVCDYKRLEPWRLWALPDAGPYPALHVSVVERVTLTGADGCGDRAKVRRPRVTSYNANYRWDRSAQRFTTQSPDIRKLAKENGNAL